MIMEVGSRVRSPIQKEPFPFRQCSVFSGFLLFATLGLSTRCNLGGRVVCSAPRVLHLFLSDGWARIFGFFVSARFFFFFRSGSVSSGWLRV